ncbi:hypothetical protein JR316_0012040 [Psilocybe cubensis]|uniref:Uncharacterized protein n=2 Tax=Psilocybe cubensis TaxID=181762 RepID=A0A8H8CFB2_PSICU|nr:hypothetical protein JR316_0012040 [Psilocybe cubensis]KAH9474942.1 hypothetical protein JR316_0012040 [Psilocybe cubensis]
MSTTVTTRESTFTSSYKKINIGYPLTYPMHPSPRIPIELLELIVDEINDRGSFHALTLTSHFFRNRVEPLLYASPMSPYPNPKLPAPVPSYRSIVDDPWVHLLFLRTVSTNPRLALLVKAYHSPSILKHADTPLWRYTARAFRTMKGLKELWLRTFDGRPAAQSLLLRRDHPLYVNDPDFERDQHRTWWNESEIRGLTLVDPGLEAVHGCGPDPGPSFQLETMYWGCRTWNDEPGLSEFLRTQNAISALVLDEKSSTSAYINGLGTSGMGKLRALYFEATIYRPSFGVGVVEYLRGLEVLELDDCHEEDLMVLQRLPCLRELVLSSKRINASKPPIPLSTLFFFAIPASGPLLPPSFSPNLTSPHLGSHSNFTALAALVPPRPIKSIVAPPSVEYLFTTCWKLECIDVALSTNLIPSVVMADFSGHSEGSGSKEVKLYARWKGRRRWLDGGKTGFDLLTMDQVRRGRLTSRWVASLS